MGPPSELTAISAEYVEARPASEIVGLLAARAAACYRNFMRQLDSDLGLYIVLHCDQLTQAWAHDPASPSENFSGQKGWKSEQSCIMQYYAAFKDTGVLRNNFIADRAECHCVTFLFCAESLASSLWGYELEEEPTGQRKTAALIQVIAIFNATTFVYLYDCTTASSAKHFGTRKQCQILEARSP